MNWIRDYVDLSGLEASELAHELTMRTVEVEDIIVQKETYDKIVVGLISELRKHPNADKLKVTIVDVGADEPATIVCGGCNLYEGQRVIVALPGSYVRWHGEGEPVEIKSTKLRGVMSYGMICASEEVELGELFPASKEAEIVDLKDFDVPAGMPISEALQLDDIILEIDNKSLTNRPDLWGHYGIAREFAAIFKRELKPLTTYTLDTNLRGTKDALPITIEAPERCLRYAGLVFTGVDAREAPYWMRLRLSSAGMSPHNCLIDITNYVMLTTGCPTHGFDRRFVEEEIIVREAKPGETLELLDDTFLELTGEDLVICDAKEPMALAGIKGGKKDSLHEDTTELVLEVAIFDAISIRKTAQRFNIRTEASARYEKALDTPRADQSLALACDLIFKHFPAAKLLGYEDVVAKHTEPVVIQVDIEDLSRNLGRKTTVNDVRSILSALGFTVTGDEILTVTAPSWRSTGDIEEFCDIVEEVARIIGYENFAYIPPVVTMEKAVKQDSFDLERKVREYLAFRCGFREVFTYPWVDDQLLEAVEMADADLLRLAQPPAPEQSRLRPSLVPSLLNNARSNLRFTDNIRVFEMAQVFLPGHELTPGTEEKLPLQPLNLAATIVSDEDQGVRVFRELKGILEELPYYCGAEAFSFGSIRKPGWADKDVWLNLVTNSGEIIGNLGLLSKKAMNTADIKLAQMAILELNMDKLAPLPSRDNIYRPLPRYPLVEEDFALVVDEEISWEQIRSLLAPMVRGLTFVEEYRGTQIPDGKKSLFFHVKLGSDEKTLSSEEIAGKRAAIIKQLKKNFGAELRQ
ncbi:MAG TPA: phenylalanine--tRNA ligase subunit beta [Clostridiaceae bacterium]|nr:phenylalanine--tRNA ligase subunit beta [Clostridiaceae bacterium]